MVLVKNTWLNSQILQYELPYKEFSGVYSAAGGTTYSGAIGGYALNNFSRLTEYEVLIIS